jgi:POT family proton-dependent oligopeptide transporter
MSKVSFQPPRPGASPSGEAPTWFGQPRGLTILFLTEMWEKFSFYGMRALLVYYMTKQLLMAQPKASLVYGLYTAFVYFTPILGGMISDRGLGRKRAVILGGSIMALGHFMMASENLLFPALATIAIGNGLFLPSLPSQIGSLYPENDPRRGSAYNVYYVGINLGAFLAPLGCGTVGELYGWHWGFGLAGVGMLSGLVIYLAGVRYLPPQPPPARSAEAIGEPPTDLRRTLLLLAAIGLAVVVLRGAYEQIGNTIALWTDEQVDRRLASGLVIPMTWFQALNPLLVFLVTPLLVAHWSRRSRQGREPSPAIKMSLGALGMAAAYGLIAAVSAYSEGQGAPASWLWLTAFIAVLTTAELFVLPIGLGLFARLAPASLAATTIAAWFLAAFAGNLLAGVLGSLWSRIGHPLFFLGMAALALVSALLLRLLDGPARRLEALRAAPAAQAPASAQPALGAVPATTP